MVIRMEEGTLSDCFDLCTGAEVFNSCMGRWEASFWYDSVCVQFTVYSIISFVDPFWLLLLLDLVVVLEV